MQRGLVLTSTAGKVVRNHHRRFLHTVSPFVVPRSAKTVTRNSIVVAGVAQTSSSSFIENDTFPNTSPSLISVRGIATPPDVVQQKIATAVKKAPVVLFMKGYPEQPMCGFSRSVSYILEQEGVKFDSYNVLDDDGLREGIKEFSNWRTIPQLYIGGEFIGGADITSQLHKSGELAKLLEKAGAVKREQK